MTNPIGFGKSENKYECCYAAIVNLPPRLRFNMDVIQLLELTNAKAFKAYGAARILSGVNPAGIAPCMMKTSRQTCADWKRVLAHRVWNSAWSLTLHASQTVTLTPTICHTPNFIEPSPQPLPQPSL